MKNKTTKSKSGSNENISNKTKSIKMKLIKANASHLKKIDFLIERKLFLL